MALIKMFTESFGKTLEFDMQHVDFCAKENNLMSLKSMHWYYTTDSASQKKALCKFNFSIRKQKTF